MEKTYECLKDTLEEQIKLISKKGDKITPDDNMSLYYALKSLKEIERKMMNPEGMMTGQDEYAYGYGYARPDNIYGTNYANYGTNYGTNRSPVTGRFIGNGTTPHGTMRMAYGDPYDHMYGHSIKDRMVAALEPMYDQAKSEHERQVISSTINHIQSNN